MEQAAQRILTKLREAREQKARASGTKAEDLGDGIKPGERSKLHSTVSLIHDVQVMVYEAAYVALTDETPPA